MLPSALPLSSNITLPLLHKPHILAFSFRPLSKSHVCFAFSSSNENPIGEEARWLREEQRWLREEQRWLREESRWNAERQALLQEINSLKLRIQELERLNSLQGASVSETVASIAKLLQVVKEADLGKNVNRIADSGTSAVPLVVEAAMEEEEVVIKEVISIPDKKEAVQKRATLRMGSEGDEVQAMQEALQKLGFYSGEEDIEYSSFSSGTERAVKTWQATLGAPEDGIMTGDLLERLFGSSGFGVTGNQELQATGPEKSANGVPVAAITDISEVEQTVVTEEGVAKVEVSQHRVFLLGENRWEEPSRLSGNSKTTVTKSTSGNAATKCVACRGEGRLLCMECDGTGEPNIEPQFMEWVDEGSKCPYCEGLGYTTCDVCGARTATAA
ncbi:protein disulfide isomerase pTAC5, chloroplastic [Sesamum alatum]|uniref:Protein disulfide isomerase pTAC5, chloroplastic n=1 Tax=Sesamum alatum TaxID=300844 RepID=A0AAE1Y879_9LAMI|nr:protein disulfide isomerase pTAC5, chloroplastic [Sesamum alatum]